MEDSASSRSVPRKEVLAAILLGIAAILTAWSAYRASLTRDEVIRNYSEMQKTISEANDTFGKADQLESLEQEYFLQFAINAAEGDEAATTYLTATMGDELYEAVEWWMAEPEETQPFSPFDETNPSYVDLPSQRMLAGGNEMLEDAKGLREAAERADADSDRFELANVFYAITLFLAGIAALLSSDKVSHALLGVSVAVMLFGTVIMITTPGAFTLT